MRFFACFLSSIAVVCSLTARATQPVAPSPGDQAFQAGDFDRASTIYKSEHAKDPRNLHVLLRMGDVALFADKLTEAERDYRNALAINPSNKWAKRSLSDIQQRRGSGTEFVITNPGNTAIVPFVTTDPLPIVRVRLSNDREANFLIDTGAPAIVLAPSVAKALGLKVAQAGMGIFAGGLRAPIRTSMLDSITCDSITVSHIPVSVMPLQGAPSPAGIHVDGILGTSFFYHFLATLDYVHGRLILAPRKASDAFEQAASKHGDTIVRMWYVPDHFLFAQARVNNGAIGLFNIDTGGEGMGLQATKHTVKGSHIDLDLAHKSQFNGGGGSITTIPFHAAVTVGHTAVRNLPGQYFPDGDQYGIFPFTVSGTISHEYFRHLAVTFDFVAMKMVLAR